jgi:hypothetical protein
METIKRSVWIKSRFTILVICIGFVFVSSFVSLTSASQKNEDLGLPQLHKTVSVTLGPSYSCGSGGQVQSGAGSYESSALFLSKYSHQMNAPELLFNGACGAEDYLQSSLAGDEMSLIADLGKVPIENVASQFVFNAKGVHSFDLYTKFAKVAKIQANHTYAVVVNSSRVRGLFVFTVVDYVPNKKLDLQYAVKDYQVLSVQSQSPGFDWGKGNL